jgi:ferredoxin
MKLRVTDRCQGHMMCMLAADDLFRIDDQIGNAHVIHEEVPVALEDAARLAVRSCPERAIEILDVDDTTHQESA